MSIATKTGDTGTTGLMYNRRVPKTHPRVEAYGTVDELNAALGLARASSPDGLLRDHLLGIQKQLVTLMGELATEKADLPRYIKDGYELISPDAVAPLDALVYEIESAGVSFNGWATPGATLTAAFLDRARTVCRRAERCVARLQEAGETDNPDILVYLNRLSDVLWLLARREETKNEAPSAPSA
jgi:cob(I)alamin adenosyltransferase